jgi:hypothetical protein
LEIALTAYQHFRSTTNHSIDTAILYLNRDELDEEILQKFKDLIAPLDCFAFNIPFGMQPITSCSAYGEQLLENELSFGQYRAMVIYAALKGCINNQLNGIDLSLEQELEKSCINHGLDPDNPAFLMNNEHKFINAIPHFIP